VQAMTNEKIKKEYTTAAPEMHVNARTTKQRNMLVDIPVPVEETPYMPTSPSAPRP